MTQYIEQHYPEKITLQDIANSADISKSEALRCFKNGVQAAPFVYLNRYRLHIAKSLLTGTTRPITDIAESVGFDSVSYFDRMFKRTFGMTPRAMR
ncbi:MAG: helix-turn-helix transcriptional regulator [Lachnospiraceae bacterium]